MIIQYQKTNNEMRELQGKGFSYEKIINGKIRAIDWNTFMTKNSNRNHLMYSF